jgi:hypothetical protein
MALGKSIMTSRGTASYWILGVTWRDNFNKTAFISLYGYESKEHCDLPMAIYKEMRTYNVNPEDFNNYFSLSNLKIDGKCDLDQYYKFIKATDSDFAFSEDLIMEEL